MRHVVGRWLPLVLVMTVTGCAAIDRLTGEGEARRIRKIGTTADAVVLSIRDTGMTVNDDPIVAFRLRVRPSAGAPYEAETRARVGRLDVPQIQPGAVLPVAIDPDDPAKVALRLYRDR